MSVENIKKNDERVEDTRYRENIPDQVIEEMPLEIIEQYYLWNEVIKKEIERYPWLLLPLIREIFYKKYPEGIQLKLIATEYVVRRIHKTGGSTLNSIFADIALQIGEKDIYHLECQMNKDREMVLRMLEYDIHIGMIHGIGSLHGDMLPEEKYEITMPRSVILYLNHLDNVPSKEICLIRFADGTTHEYSVPVMKIQNYTIEMIEEKHLNMLIPFLPIRFRKYLNRKKDGVKLLVSETVRKELTEFVHKCIMIIDREKRNGTLTDMAGKDIMDLLSITCGYLFKNEPELNKEVQGIMKPIIMLQSERAEIAEKELEEIRPIVKLQSERAEMAEKELEEIRPIVKLQSERAEMAEKELEEIRPIVKLQSERAEIAEKELEEIRPIVKLQSERAKMAEKELEEMRSILKQQSEKAEITEKELEKMRRLQIERSEASIKKFIERAQSSGQNRQNIKEDIQDIFSLNEGEVEEKLKKYWK